MLYLLERFPEKGGHLIPSTPALRAKARLISRLVDVYINPIQVSMPAALPLVARQQL